ncbi:MAG: nitroreductase family protein [Ignavibacteriales bacterium]|nr:nitroreductase family protein [Ignavibacteriales bacterium]MCF8314843.1 nitroreductase family protein [Ignavibacteriales bacterium]MCF8436208.1 nitroreductase family protein [Ignavibacteriales bacterium]
MEFSEVVSRRASIRKFKDVPVSKDHIRRMVEIAGMAPSINNSQPWHFTAVTNKTVLKQISAAVSQKIKNVFPVGESEKAAALRNKIEKFSTFFENAPLLFALSTLEYTAEADGLDTQSGISHENINQMRNYPNIQTIGATIENLLLAAVDLGYGACWLSGPMVAKTEIESILRIELPMELSAFVAVGVPFEETHSRKEKKSVDKILSIID